LRNELVHHFSERHDLWSTDGCRNALQVLTENRATIKRHHESLRAWANRLDSQRRAALDLVKSDVFRDRVNGISPTSSIVAVLRGASGDLAIEGWTRLAEATRWIAERHPHETPKRYGCRRWQQVVHEAGVFELRYRKIDDGPDEAWYRERTQQISM
jgi:hypothetical protein